MDKNGVLDAMHKRYRELDALISPLSEKQLTIPGVNGAWSIKDVVAHLTSWNRFALAALQAAVQGNEPVYPVDISLDDDVVNEQFYQANKLKPLNEVRSEFRVTFLQMIEAIEALSEEALFDPQRFSWRNGRPLYLIVLGSGYGHYEEHIEQIRAWLASSSSSAQ